MGGGTVFKVEAASAALASATLAGALGFAAYAGLDVLQPALRAVAASAAASTGLLGAWGFLARVGRQAPDFAIATFDLGAVHISPGKVRTADILELDVVYQEPLELDDVLEQIGPGARVVRLFNPAAMPTPGELRERIDRHLERGPPPVASHDDSQALIEALTQLRQSLR